MADILMQNIAKEVLTKDEFTKLQNKIMKDTKKIATRTAEGIALQNIDFHSEISPKECSVCGHSNPPDAKYCNQCRRKL
jgi:hypothetical protein